jgi:hypothetical protein
MFDLYFFYKYIGRYILYLKYSKFIYNFKNLSKLNNLIVYFNVNNITDINTNSLMNYFYFFKYYFSVVPYFSNYVHNFHLNINYYSFFIQYNFYGKKIYYILYFFLNDVYSMLNKTYILLNFNENFFEFTVNDMNFFVEKRSSLGFFNLKHNINFKFISTTMLDINNVESLNLFYLFKFRF